MNGVFVLSKLCHHFAHSSNQVTTLAGRTQGFLGPNDVTLDVGGNVFVSEDNNRIRRIDWATRYVSTVAGNGVHDDLDGVGIAAEFKYPIGISMLKGSIWIVDVDGGTLRRIGMA